MTVHVELSSDLGRAAAHREHRGLPVRDFHTRPGCRCWVERIQLQHRRRLFHVVVIWFRISRLGFRDRPTRWNSAGEMQSERLEQPIRDRVN